MQPGTAIPMRRLATETVACPGRVRQLPSVCGVGESSAELPRTPDRIAGLTETRQSPARGSIATLLRGAASMLEVRAEHFPDSAWIGIVPIRGHLFRHRVNPVQFGCIGLHPAARRK